MTTSLLAYIPSPAQGVWHLGPVPIRAYALCIITGIIAALIIGDRRWVARGGEAGVIYDIALWTVPFGLIGGRLYHLMTDWRTYFAEGGAGFGAAVRIWDGGLGIWGAVALGGVGAWIGCRRHGIPLPAFGDAIAPGIILAQAIGRLGNYFNQELYGRPTDLPWGLQIFQRSDGSGVVNPHLLNGVSTGQVYEVVHPTFLYELLWNLLVFFFLLWADRRFRLGHGRLFALYVAAYCVGRFGVELMRSDTATLIAGIRVNSFTSTFVFIGAVVYMMVAPRGREDPATLGGRQAEEAEAEAEAEGAALAVPVAVAAGAGAVADEADAVETQSDEPVALAEQAVDTEDTVDEDAADAEAAVEESVDESGEEPVDSDEVEEEDESDAEAEELDADEAETAEAEAVEVAQESEGTT
ncbi:MAG: prolipoprotein diacylglyceryl transferase, partial [Mycolicibacterium sp.]|uniref:prolipoprotein diacylglyceryl transferase n=1 Tax=Mycolicibacterium sp. TaxID=2320850 RepID=UPI000FA7DCD5